ncbi:MAG TPA: hypothetical protein PK222_07840 [Bacteroidales bacterium]|nr:hypothetical protein [Bacteroidales bacterium]
MENSNIFRIYVIGGYNNTVFYSQILEWTYVLSQFGVITTCLSILTDKSKLIDIKKQEEIKSRINGDFHQIVIGHIPFLNQVKITKNVINYYKRLHSQNEESIIIIQFRRNIPIFIIILKLFPQIKIIYESRGSETAEYWYKRQKTYKNKIRFYLIKIREYISLKISDNVICVSNKQKEYYTKTYGSYLARKYIVIPGAANKDIFFYSNQIRNDLREKYNIQDNVVYLYSGTLSLEYKWHIPDVLFSVIKEIYNYDNSSIFLFLTPDIDIAEYYFNLLNIPYHNYIIKYIDIKNMNPYLNMADYAFLLREDEPINNQASPTKFAEYALTGLRIIISENVGDYTEYVKKENIGIVYKNNRELIQQIKEDRELGFYNNPKVREKNAQKNQDYLSMQSYIPKIINIYAK